ncbi:hypothetical protein MTBBW1_1890021 [Desulfamplus magnetovallimortis]|uniref:Uncharacterized protein n=1 Tax=Desulfamplus magnetovallimortis TaxID=1246637 RepID=A0A1W1HB10_9BACT|nr:hypothetical protein MTBBW1_1890021 [Desulfamplus magnetovallimortis]
MFCCIKSISFGHWQSHDSLGFERQSEALNDTVLTDLGKAHGFTCANGISNEPAHP